MKFPYQPIQFIVHRNSIVCVEYADNYVSEVHVYDKDGKEQTAFEENGPVYSLFADQNRIFYEMQDISTLMYRVCCLNLDTSETSVIMENSTLTFDYENNGKIAVHVLSQPFSEDTDAKDIEITSGIISLDDQVKP